MKKLLRLTVWALALVLAAALIYAGTGYREAIADAPELSARADALIAAGQGGDDLGKEHKAMLLAVEDPAFYQHVGFDLTTPGSGITTLTQSLAKREGFADFRPGIKKLRQTAYAIGLERSLGKDQILALFLHSVDMGRGPDGDWITGLFAASDAHFGQPPAALSDADFARLVAVMIAPGELELAAPGPALETRVARIQALLAGDCRPDGNGDVWLAACSG